jgi:integration host factor subunit beta
MSELVKVFSAQFVFFKEKEIKQILDVIFSRMIEQFQDGGRIEIRDFGNFIVNLRSARLTRNPKTGETLQSEPKKYVRFRASKKLKNLVNSVPFPSVIPSE